MSIDSRYADLARELIKGHEGIRFSPYQCPAGKLTIGYGRNLEDCGISQDEADYLLDNDVIDCIVDLESFKFWEDLDEVRKAVLVDMRYNLGATRFRKFKKMIQALMVRDYKQASVEMKDSRWYGQVGLRAKTLCKYMSDGAF